MYKDAWKYYTATRHRRLSQGCDDRATFGILFFSLSSTFNALTTMGCCGEPVDKPTPQTITQFNHGIITQQPGPYPSPEEQKPLQRPTIPSPSPVHTHSGAAATSWGQPMQAQTDQFGNYATPVPPINNQPYHGSMFNTVNGFGGSINDQIIRPESAHHRPTISVSSTFMTAPPSQTISSFPDERKMSIAIDFGFVLFCLFVLHLTDIWYVGTTFSGVVRISMTAICAF